MERIAVKYGIRGQTVSKRFARMKILARFIKIPDENSLRALYSNEKKTLQKITEELETNVYSVNKALKLYKIPKRGGASAEARELI